jgi:Fe-S oxidoreductase
MKDGSYINAFDPEGKSETLCEKCGLCLQRCPVMRMGKEEARAEQARLRNGEETSRVLKECTFCYNCNQYCPHGLNPLALIMERISDNIKRAGKGVPEYLRYLFTGHGETSVFADAYKMLPEAERAVLDTWERCPPKSEEVLFIGCIGREIPYGIEHSSTLKKLPKYAPRDACCGELPFRLGDFKAFTQTVERTSGLFEGLKTERLICYCGSCSHSFNNIWRQYLDAKPPFEIITVWEWLWEKVQQGELKVQRKIERKVALTDSCYASELGDRFFEALRGLHEAVGMEVVELANNRNDNLCCGMPCVIRNNFDILEPLKVAEKKIEQVREARVSAVYCYCPGCFMQLGRAANNVGVETHYSLEEILWALGDDYPVPLRKRTKVQGKLFMEKLQSCIAGSQAPGGGDS